jgi:cell division protein ZapB
MTKLEDLAEREDRLLLRHQELKRTSRLIEQQLRSVSAERDSLRSRLGAARARIDALLERLPPEGQAGSEAAAPAVEPPARRSAT